MADFDRWCSPVLQFVSSSRKRLENRYKTMAYVLVSPVLQFVFSPVSVSYCFLTVSPVLQLPYIYKYITGDPSGLSSLFIHICGRDSGDFASHFAGGRICESQTRRVG